MKLLSRLAIISAALLAVALVTLTGCSGTDPATADAQNVTGQVQPRFEIFEGADGQFYFHLKAANNEIVLQSEGYVAKAGAENGVESVKTHGVDLDNYELLENVAGEFYFNIKAANNEIIGTSESYVSKSNAETGMETVRELIAQVLRFEAADTGGAAFEIFEGADGQYYFHLKAANGEIVLQSEGYVAKAGAINGIESVRVNGKDSEQYDVLEAEDGSFYFVLKADNNEVIGVSEMYVSKSNAEQGVETVVALLLSERVADAQ